MKKFLSKKEVLFLLLIIICIAIFFRAYKAYERFEYAHDGDIYSWIVKDIVVNKHFRLIGQETSQTGVFIGPLFYYSLVPYFLAFDMRPTGAILFGIVLSIGTILSYFYIFKKLINEWAGLVAAFLQSVLLTRVLHDRWIVPTNTTFIWEIWFFYAVLNIAKGNFFYLPILGFLIGLVWHISLVEAPVVLSAVIAFFLAKKVPTKKQLFKTLIAFLIPSVPLFLFEFRHGFTQLKAVLGSLLANPEGVTLGKKLLLVLTHINSNINSLSFYPNAVNTPFNLLAPTLLLSILFTLYFKKFISKKVLIIILTWIFFVIAFFSFSSKMISEYYFSNIETIFLIIIIFGLSYILRFKIVGFISVSLFLSILLINNLKILIDIADFANFGYKERQEVTRYIIEDSKKRGFPCVGISYITTPGNQFGFRYMFYINNLKITKPSPEVPVYNIVLPFDLSKKEINYKSGLIGVIVPKGNDYKNIDEICSGKDLNISEPLWGYVE